jgi:hypothetical protein
VALAAEARTRGTVDRFISELGGTEPAGGRR